MHNQEFKNLEFYREQYLFEIERGRFYDKIIQYPTTLLIVFIGSVFYMFNYYYPKGHIQVCSIKDFLFIGLLCLFTFAIITTIYFLGSVFHGFTRLYGYLPYTGILSDHEIKLYRYYYKYSEKEKCTDKRLDAIDNGCRGFSLNLKKYYIDLTDINQRINDDRAYSYDKTRTFLLVDLMLLIIIGIIGFLK